MKFGFLTLLVFLSLLFSLGALGDWGFYGHRLINRMAVFTLPPEMLYLFKPNLEFISEHAVDPDKRRYASAFEATRHYIDLDHWGQAPFENLPRHWSEALIRYCDIIWHQAPDDSIIFKGEEIWRRYYSADSNLLRDQNILFSKSDFPQFFMRSILPGYYEDTWEVDCALWRVYLNLDEDTGCEGILVVDSLSGHGILPYHLIRMQSTLTQAFLERDKGRIIRLAAEMGHYIGDAHVPLHTTSNYNGQFTDQLGIHAFWESRIPELFAEEQYDFFVGKADYISDPRTFYWDIVLSSNAFVDSVLLIEKELSNIFPTDQQYCFDERLDVTVRTQCPAYAEAYQNRMQGMVEDRMRKSILAIGSSWYTAWVDAGQPDFRKDRESIGAFDIYSDESAGKRSGRIRLRSHE
ncbi:MAG: hypothetical protein KDC80_11600 [Saprospiraceae bacterium]|nr:hypothetical protein [Saprospiraceae bacterium]